MAGLVFMGAAVTAQAAQSEADAQQYDLNFAKGVIRFDDGHYEEAEALFRKALEAKPDDPEATYYLGQTLTRAKKHEAAEAVFRSMTERDPGSGRAWLGLGIAQYNLAKYDEATASLATAETLTSDDPLVFYYQGLTHHQQGAYELSPSRFLRALSLSPDLADSAHYYSGVAYYNRGIVDEARDEFTASLATGQPESEMARSAREYLAQLQGGAAAPRADRKRWDLMFSVSPQYDSNVVLLPLGTQPPGGSTGISRKSDYLTALFGRGEYRVIQNDLWTVGATYSLYLNYHRTLSGFDVEDHTPTVYAQRQIGPLQARLQYVYDYVKVGRAPYLVGNAFQPLFTLTESDSAFTQLQLRYQNKDFQDARFAGNSFRDGKNWLIGLTQYFLFAEKEGHVRVGFTYDMDRTGGGNPSIAVPGNQTNADWAYDGYRVSSGVGFPPVKTIRLNLSFDYYRQEYLNPNSFSGSGAVRRADNMYFFAGSLRRDFGENVSAALEYSYTRDQNNIQVFDYNRNLYSFTVSARF